MEQSTIWWFLAGSAIAVELVTGTFYLLMLAVGLAAAALAAHAGASLPAQLVWAAVLSSAAIGGWHVARGRMAPKGAKDLNLDVGEAVQVVAWNPDGTADVQYRGANWAATAAYSAPSPGQHRVREIAGSRLVLEKI